MNEKSWQEARLIPTPGIGGPGERERCASSVLLAVLASVRGLGRAITVPLGAPIGEMTTRVRPCAGGGLRPGSPDGLIRVHQGERVWTAFVTVRLGADPVDPAQVQPLIEVAAAEGVDAVVTISNEEPVVVGVPGENGAVRPSTVARHSLTWSRLLRDAHTHVDRQSAGETGEAWIVGELIRYLEDPASGVPAWSSSAPHASPAPWVSPVDDRPRGTARAERGRAALIESVLGAVDAFYLDVIDDLRAWTETPARLRMPLGYDAPLGGDSAGVPRPADGFAAPSDPAGLVAAGEPTGVVEEGEPAGVVEAGEPAGVVGAGEPAGVVGAGDPAGVAERGGAWLPPSGQAPQTAPIDLRTPTVLVLSPSPVALADRSRAPAGPLPSRRELRAARQAAAARESVT